MTSPSASARAGYRLDRVAPGYAAAPALQLDAAQQAVVDHPGGPLLVLAGPGTGKTSTLVAAVLDRVRRGTPIQRILVLTFGRNAAADLRDRITARLENTVATLPAMTFHSFAYAVVRRFTPAGVFSAPLRLPSGPAQAYRLQEVLRTSVETGRVRWPDGLAQAIGTRGMAEEVAGLFGRARQLGMDPIDLAELGRTAGRPDWEAVAYCFEEYLDVLDAEGVIDYTELIHRAGVLAADPDNQAELRTQYDAVFVDEYQDTDPAQVRLLQAVAGDGRDLVAVGDPDQSIYAFRGADPGGLMRFPDAFRTCTGDRAPQLPLTVSRRFGERLARVSRRVCDRLGVPAGLDRDAVQQFRHPETDAPDHGPGRAEVRLFTSPGAQADHIADLLRRAHLDDAIPYSQMAILVRSGRSEIPQLRRALAGAGIPVDSTGDEPGLGQDPSVAPMLLALRALTAPETLGPSMARDVALSPLGGLDEAQLRQVARRLRRAAADDLERDPATPLPGSAELLNAALFDPGATETDPRRGGATDIEALDLFHRLAQRMLAARRALDDGAGPSEVMWRLWSQSVWERRLRAGAAAAATGPSSRAAHRALDALVALFDAAARSEELSGIVDVRSFLNEISGLDVPAARRSVIAAIGGVRLMTAHRAKGLQWRLVVVASVQAGLWPTITRRSSLLEADRLGRDDVLEPPSIATRVAEERRLFYVALTRARERLIVTAVAAPEADGPQPSRFLDDLQITPVTVPGRPRRPLTFAGLVAELRHDVADPTAGPALRRAAAQRLAHLAELAETKGTPTAAAHPDRWWGAYDITEADVPIVAPGLAPRLSGSALQRLSDCPLQWFLEKAGGAGQSTMHLGFGNIVHALADAVARGELPADLAVLEQQVDAIWPSMDYEAAWLSNRERGEISAALARFLAWADGRSGRQLISTEYDFEADVEVGGAGDGGATSPEDGADAGPGPRDTVRLRGRIDRLELDGDGLHVIDLKTGRRPPPRSEVRRHLQLALYQRACASDEALQGTPVAGAELVQLRHSETKQPDQPLVRSQPALTGDEELADVLDAALATASRRIRAEDFPARRNSGCKHCSFHAICPLQPGGRQVIE